jgi:hypothetical protein
MSPLKPEGEKTAYERCEVEKFDSQRDHLEYLREVERARTQTKKTALDDFCESRLEADPRLVHFEDHSQFRDEMVEQLLLEGTEYPEMAQDWRTERFLDKHDPKRKEQRQEKWHDSMIRGDKMQPKAAFLYHRKMQAAGPTDLHFVPPYSMMRDDDDHAQNPDDIYYPDPEIDVRSSV